MTMRGLIEQKIEEAYKVVWTPKMTAKQWKLYSPSDEQEKALADQAVLELNTAMGRFQKVLRKELSKVTEYETEIVGPVAGKLYKKIVDPVHSSHAEVGGDDTPAREVSVLAAIQMIKDIYGKTGWTSLGRYFA